MKLYVAISQSAPFVLEVPESANIDQLHDLASTAYLELYEGNPYILHLNRACRFQTKEVLLVYDKITLDPESPIDISLQEQLYIYEEPKPTPKSPILIPCPGMHLSKLVPKLTTLNRLILTMTLPDSDYLLDVFFHHFDMWTSSDVVIRKILDRYDVHPPSSLTSASRKKWMLETRQPIQRCCAKAVYKLYNHRPEVFSSQLKEEVTVWTNNMAKDGLGAAGVQISELLKKEIVKDETLPEGFENKLLLKSVDKGADFWSYDVIDLSRALTFVDLISYSKMKYHDFVGQKYAKKKHLVPAIVRAIHLFNQLSNFVSVSILKAKDNKVRRQLVIKAITLADRLHSDHSYNCMSAVAGGVSNAAVKRLKTVMEGVPLNLKSRLQELNALMNPKGNYKLYRAELREVPRNRLVVPWLGVFFRDLTFIEDGNAKVVDNLLNFYRAMLLHNTIQQCLYWQVAVQKVDFDSVDYSSLVQIEQHQQIDEKLLFALSMEVQPRKS
ncbi:hypothetical protein GEMRC1_014075 [Eukaryota sp. GEM-RC1]